MNNFIQLTSKTFNFIDNNRYFNWFFLLLKRFNILKIFNKKMLKIFLEFCIIFMYTKDSLIISNWLKYIFEKIYYKNHKKVLFFFKNIIYYLFRYFKFFFNIKGIFFKIKGKIALSKNSKKKKFVIKLGSYSLVKKDNFVNFNKNLIKTITGVLGYVIFIFF